MVIILFLGTDEAKFVRKARTMAAIFVYVREIGLSGVTKLRQ